jgi:glucose-6-phosphate isomerase/transaldolase/glucose-6-phosphate isomerase
MSSGTIHPGPLEQRYRAALEQAGRDRVRRRLWDRDHTLWKPSPEEIADRLGWLDCPRSMAPFLPEVEAFAESVRKEGFRRVLLLGMGGSSLAPELFARFLGTKRGLPLEILDTTDPATIRDFTDRFPPGDTLFLVSTKSGGTVETLSLLKYFYRLAVRSLGKEEAGGRFAAVTDPGSGLAALAEAGRFRKTFLNAPDIGGRFSALSLFGLVPAALAGADPRRILADAALAVEREQRETGPGCVGGLELGIFLGEAARAGRDKLVLRMPPEYAPAGDWIEQLLAESTGKEGVGILPVPACGSGESTGDGEDRVCVLLQTGETSASSSQWRQWAERQGCPWIALETDPRRDLGAFLFLWEAATAYACWRLGVNPFDQPDVESAKEETRLFLRDPGGGAEPPGGAAAGAGAPGPGPENGEREGAARALRTFLSETAPGAYVALQAFLPCDPAVRTALDSLRQATARLSRRPVTAGFGPRYLHSTGQLHKGDAGRGLFVQITAPDREDLPIPDSLDRDESTLTFGALKRAQAAGDRAALARAGRQVFHLHLAGDPAARLHSLAAALEG